MDSYMYVYIYRERDRDTWTLLFRMDTLDDPWASGEHGFVLFPYVPTYLGAWVPR